MRLAGDAPSLALVEAASARLLRRGEEAHLREASLGRGVAPVLIGVRPDDPWTLVAVGALAAAACLLTAWLPARRAARTNAVDALKAE